MSRNPSLIVIVSCVILAAIEGCTYSHNVTRRSELVNPNSTGAIFILTKDSTLYSLHDYRQTDSSLVGVGTTWKQSPRANFTGELKFSDIAYIRADKSNFFKGLLVAGFTGYFIATIAQTDKDNVLSATVKTTYHGPSYGGNPSCPLVYSWNGNRYVPEAEVIVTALSKGLETESFCTLPSLVNDNSQLKLQIRDIEPETDYLNSISLLSVTSPANSDVVLDIENTPWSICNAQAPMGALDQEGNNVTDMVVRDDGRFWETDPTSTKIDPGDETTLDLTFPRPNAEAKGTLVVNAMNTRYMDCIVQTLSDFLGDEIMPFVRALDGDPEMINLVKQWFNGLALRVYVGDLKGWTYAGAIPIEANQTAFRRGIRIEVPNAGHDPVKIQLRCPVATWKLDAVKIDWSTTSPLQTKPVRLISATDTRGKDVRSVLASADNQYVTMLPPDSLSLVFEPQVASEGNKISYIARVSGFLHEWIPNPQASPYAMSGSSEGRVEALKDIMKANPQQIVQGCFQDRR